MNLFNQQPTTWGNDPNFRDLKIKRYLFSFVLLFTFTPMIIGQIVLPQFDSEQHKASNTFIKNLGQVSDMLQDAPARDVNYYSMQADFYDYLGSERIAFMKTILIDTPNRYYDVHKIHLTFENGSLLNQIPYEQGTIKRNFYFTRVNAGIENVKEYGSVYIKDLYEGKVDLEYTHNDAGPRLFYKCEFPEFHKDIIMDFQGVNPHILNNHLRFPNPIEAYEFRKPIAYQVFGSTVVEYDIEYVDLGNNKFGFALLENVDPLTPLYICMDQGDNQASLPKATGDNAVWSTYFGENGTTFLYDVTSDAAGNVYYTGSADAIELLTTIGMSSLVPHFGVQDAFIVKFNSDMEPQWYTYIGGGSGMPNSASGSGTSPADDHATSIALTNNEDELYITGFTRSDYFTMYQTGEYYDSNNQAEDCATGDCGEIFVSRFNQNGILQWSTTFGGAGREFSQDVHVDRIGNAYIVGDRNANTDLVNLNGAYNNSDGTSLLLKFNAGNQLVWSTGLGHTERANAVYTDNSLNAVVVGYTQSNQMLVLNPDPNVPSTQSFNGIASSMKRDGFVQRFSSVGQQLNSFYYGGSCTDILTDLGMDIQGNIYISGKTGYPAYFNPICLGSTDLPVIGNGYSQQPTSYPLDHFVLKINAYNQSNTTVISHAGYFGGSDEEWITNGDLDLPLTEVRISVSKGGLVALTGATESSTQYGGNTINLPQYQPVDFYYQTDRDLTGGPFSPDAYIAVFDNSLNLKWSTYFGHGRWGEGGTGLSFSEFEDGRLYFCGTAETHNGINANTAQEELFVEEYDIIDPNLNDYFLGDLSNYPGVNAGWLAFFTVDGIFNPDYTTNIETPNGSDVLIFPNPTNGVLNIQTELKLNKVTIIDSKGAEVLVFNNSIQSLDVSSLAHGVYTVRIESETGIYNLKFVR